jgi:predicted alpha/beta hydrolase
MTATRCAPRDLTVPARDGYRLAASLFDGGSSARVIVVNGATAVPRRFYRHFAAALAEAGYAVVTYDYRGIELRSPAGLRRLEASARDWALADLPGVVDWVAGELRPDRIFLIGHSFGGQVAGMYDHPDRVGGMVTMSAQSGHWRLQGGVQKLVVWLHIHLTLPLLPRILGYMPMKAVGAGENLPAGVAREWARWCRHPDYLLGDPTLPLDRFRDFTAPVLAYSFGDDDWGTPRSVDAMMRAYPEVERRHVEPRDFGLGAIGHLGFFRPGSEALWRDAIDWLDSR